MRWTAAQAAGFATLSGLAALDLFGDLRAGTTAVHALVEGGIIAIGGLALVLSLRRYAALRRVAGEAVAEASLLARDLADSRAEAERWRAEAGGLAAGLGELIEAQFERWELSAAEREVARLLLKGLSHKQISGLRGVSAATVRQQATAVYRKARLEGRHDLAAFFLEDLLAPRAVDGAGAKAAGTGAGAGATAGTDAP